MELVAMAYHSEAHSVGISGQFWHPALYILKLSVGWHTIVGDERGPRITEAPGPCWYNLRNRPVRAQALSGACPLQFHYQMWPWCRLQPFVVVLGRQEANCTSSACPVSASSVATWPSLPTPHLQVALLRNIRHVCCAFGCFGVSLPQGASKPLPRLCECMSGSPATYHAGDGQVV
jgi:hypothetical protein